MFEISSLRKVLLGVMIILVVVVVVILLLCKNTNVIVWTLFSSAIAIIIAKIVNEDFRKDYKDNIAFCNDRLNRFKDLLGREEYGIDSKEKMSALMSKIQRKIDKHDMEIKEKRKNNWQFYSVIIIPLVFIIVNSYSSSNSTVDTAYVILVGIFLLVYFRFCFGIIIDAAKTFINPTYFELERMMEDLQDIYDRDFLK